MDTENTNYLHHAKVHFQARANALLDGDYAWLTKHTRFPFVRYEGELVVVETSPEQTRSSLTRKRRGFLLDGVTEISVSLIALEETDANRIKATTTWECRDAYGNVPYCAIYHFFGEFMSCGTFVAEMVEYEPHHPRAHPLERRSKYLH